MLCETLMEEQQSRCFPLLWKPSVNWNGPHLQRKPALDRNPERLNRLTGLCKTAAHLQHLGKALEQVSFNTSSETGYG